MIKRIIHFILFICFLPFFLMVFLILLFSPFMAVSEMRAVFEHGVPKSNMYFILLFMISFILYLSMRIKAFRKIYDKIPVLWPLSQMLFITLAGLAFGLLFMNLWAENALIPKVIAVILAIISFLLVRTFMSYWFSKYPVSVKMYK